MKEASSKQKPNEAKPTPRSMYLQPGICFQRERLLVKQSSQGREQFVSHGHRSSPTNEAEATERRVWGAKIKLEYLDLLPNDAHQIRNVIVVAEPTSVVVARIEKYMKDMSICFVFRSEEKELYCRTSKLLHFVVKFLKTSKSETAVNVERRKGCAIQMQSVRRSLFKAVLTGNLSKSQYVHNDYHSSLRRKKICPDIEKMFQDNCRQQRKSWQLQRQGSNCSQDMKSCGSLIGSGCDDQTRLGLESLVYMTSPNTVASMTSEKVSRALVLNEGPCRDLLRKDLVFCLERSNPALNHESLSTSWRSGFGEEMGMDDMQLLALQILTNALAIVSKLPVRLREKIDPNSLFWKSLFSILRMNLAVASEFPQEGAISAKCFGFLELLAPEIANILVDERLLSNLVAAYEYGKQHHSDLEIESQRLLRQLSSHLERESQL
jgi:hypothetical protein